MGWDTDSYVGFHLSVTGVRFSLLQSPLSPHSNPSPFDAAVTEKPKQGVLLLIRATLALYDTVGAYGYQRREGKIAQPTTPEPANLTC